MTRSGVAWRAPRGEISWETLFFMNQAETEQRYKDGSYLEHNPDFHRSDSEWKAQQVAAAFGKLDSPPASVCEVGCGAGDILMFLQKKFPQSKFTGYDISTDASKFWPALAGTGIDFHLGDFLEAKETFECITIMDVIEHLENPFDFLAKLKSRAKYFVFHFPLDLNVTTILREQPLISMRKTVGHIHYYTKGIALSLIKEAGYDVISSDYTSWALSGPRRTMKTKLASIPRRLAYMINKDLGVRMLGGETLLILAKARA